MKTNKQKDWTGYVDEDGRKIFEGTRLEIPWVDKITAVGRVHYDKNEGWIWIPLTKKDCKGNKTWICDLEGIANRIIEPCKVINVVIPL